MEMGIMFVSSTGLYRDNLASGCAAPFAGGTAAGDNYRRLIESLEFSYI